MIKPVRRAAFFGLILASLVSGCAMQPPAPATPQNPAVAELLATASAETRAGRLPQAIAVLERALRIEPRNPLLWQELARVYLQRDDYRQAEQMAARSNSWVGSNRSLLAENWRIIGVAREERGDPAGARAAFERAAQLEHL
ncbi:tetratricopeptide repeat protein [Thiohalomonas denitrificans]|uniref:tetratricopeptide repeat protein n=1 Tax=Thiohalomonas denitrificans TaxID=415747 RepID=UPI0026ECDCFF|nr:tetratricopeptide repeat protein [Thiohalomonas denitrificans]